MFMFLIVIIVSVCVLALIGTNDKIHVDAKLVTAWGLGMLTMIVLEKIV